jgi:acetolactate synthase-1/2/3 large subunit
MAAEFARLGAAFIMYVPGGPLMPFLSAVSAARQSRLVLFRHEQGAGLAAEGLARATRKPVIVAVTAGPGVSNVVTAAYVALRELSPVFILSAQVPRSALGRSAAQELDTVTLLAPLVKYSVALPQAMDPRVIVRDLWAEANSGRPGPVHLSVAADQWKELH